MKIWDKDGMETKKIKKKYEYTKINQVLEIKYIISFLVSWQNQDFKNMQS